MKTLVLSGPQGLTKLWRSETVKVANSADKIIVPGNIVSVMPKIKDGEKRGANLTILRAVFTYVETHDDAEILIGPNEIVALSNPRVWANDKSLWKLKKHLLGTPEDAIKTATVLNDRLVTHGGLTYGEWIEIGKPSNPYDAANILNKKYFGKLFTTHCYNLGSRPNHSADPIFAHPFKEFYPSWLTTTEKMPFGQILGSRSLNSDDGREAMGAEASPLYYLEKISQRKFGSIALVNEQEVTSIGLRPKGEQIPSLPDNEAYYIEIS